MGGCAMLQVHCVSIDCRVCLLWREGSFPLAWFRSAFITCNLQDVEWMEQWIVRLPQWYSTLFDDVLRSMLYVWQDGRGSWRWLSDVRYNNLRPLSKPVVFHANPRQDPWTERNRRLVCKRSSLELLLYSVHFGSGRAGSWSQSAVRKFHGKVVTWRFVQDSVSIENQDRAEHSFKQVYLFFIFFLHFQYFDLNELVYT